MDHRFQLDNRAYAATEVKRLTVIFTFDQKLRAKRLDQGHWVSSANGTTRSIATLPPFPAGERYPPLDFTSQKQKEQTLRTLVGRIEGLAARQPVLMLFKECANGQLLGFLKPVFDSSVF